ncbi:MAG TPA: hypothetical protein VG247_03865 [Pseudonocardiaceae bacterium]|jgi:fumarate reductase subunit D|nr:hypothetical protein [Pseudonocardiaceae bacterium]
MAKSRNRLIAGVLVLLAGILLPLGASTLAHSTTHTYLSSAPACGGGGSTGDD